MDLSALALFTITFASVLILPGPNSAFVMGQSIKYGFKGSIAAPLGFMSATGLHALIVFSGIGFVIQTLSPALIILKWLGVFYLLYLAFKAFTDTPSKVAVTSRKTSKLKMYYSSMIVSLTNPKALIANLMLFPLFIHGAQPFVPQAIALTFTAMAISLFVYGTYSLLASQLTTKLANTALASKLTGTLYLGAATALASKQT